GSGFGDWGVLRQDVPGLTFEMHGRSDQLGAIDDTAATDRQEEVHLILFRQSCGFPQGFVVWVPLYAAELEPGVALERRRHLLINAIGFDRAAAVGDEDACLLRQQIGQLFDLALAERDLGWIGKNKILHKSPLHAVLLL